MAAEACVSPSVWKYQVLLIETYHLLYDFHRTEPAHAHRRPTRNHRNRPLFNKNVARFTN
jgi:hypothetical protein